MKNVKVQYIDNKLFKIEGDITKSQNFKDTVYYCKTSIKEWYTPEEEKATVWRRNDKCEIYQQYKMRDKIYTFRDDSYNKYQFVKDAYYKVDIRFIYNTYWDGGGMRSRHSIILVNIRKQQGNAYIEPQKCDIKQDNVKLIPMEWQTFTNSKIDKSELKRFIDNKF